MKVSFPALVAAVFLSATLAAGQSISFNYRYKFEPVSFETFEISDREPELRSPQLGGLEVEYPEAARKNGVEGTVKATAVLGENGRVRDIMIEQDLPFGVGAAVTRALQNLSFKPATVNGKPIAITMHLDYIATLAYAEGDKNITRPQILEKPVPEYPARYLAEKLKGKVSAQIMFRSDGTLDVVSVNSVMPKEFDKAATAAAENIKFQPAVHKKSKKAVSQMMTVEFDFKP
jgi:TonB family protein